jgi:hypothetical protein
VPCFENPFQQEYFEPKKAFKSNDLKALVNISRAGWTIVELVFGRFGEIQRLTHITENHKENNKVRFRRCSWGGNIMYIALMGIRQ